MTKAQKILNSITEVETQTKRLVDQMKEKLTSTINLNERMIQDLPEKQSKILEKVNNGDIISLLFVGFAFYTGFNGFPIIHSQSIKYYKEAAKISPNAKAFLGFLYFNGIFFPRNFRKAQKYFKKSSDDGCLKAEIIDGILRKNLWRIYLLQFEMNDLFTNYVPSFKSIIPNDSLVFPKINYILENDLFNDISYEINIMKDESINDIKNYSNLSMDSSKIIFTNNLKKAYSDKIFLSSKKIEDIRNVKEQMFYAKSYFNGDNEFPVNYKKAAEYFKLAADNGNSEAQWRYAMMCINSIGFDDENETIEHYFQESAKQNNIKGKFFYSLYLKNSKNDTSSFEKLIKECCDSGDEDAMYYYAMFLENEYDESDLDKSIQYYQNASDKGNLDSLVHLINIYKKKSQTELDDTLFLSAGIMNQELLVELIEFCDKNEKYDQSDILIQIGTKINYKLFNFYYGKHLLFGRNANIKRAKKIALLAFQDNYPLEYKERYIYLMLQVYVYNDEHQKALDVLIEYQDYLREEFRNEFHIFYMKFDKKLAKQYFIPGCFYYKDFIMCHKILMKFHRKNENLLNTLDKLSALAILDNPFAMAILGRTKKQGRYIMRDLKTAIKYFACSAENKCPLGYYYIGKEYFYGRLLDQEFDKAIKYLLLALENNDEPRAGYYLYKIPNIKLYDVNDDKKLKIGADFGHKRALYKYWKRLYTGDDERIQQNEEEGIKYIQKAAFQKYKKAIKFCIFHKIQFIENKIKKNSSIDINESTLELESTTSNQDLIEEKEESSYVLINLQQDEKSSDLIRTKNDEPSSDLLSLKEEKTNANYNKSDDGKSSDLIYIKEDITHNQEHTGKDKDSSDLSSIKEDDDSISDLIGFWN